MTAQRSFVLRSLFSCLLAAGAFTAIGCTKANIDAEEPAASPAPAEALPPAQAENVEVDHAAAPPPAPPAAKVEEPGPAPSAGLEWHGGFWRWDTPKTVYVWVPGYWNDRFARPAFAPPPPRREVIPPPPSATYFYVPGYWRWDGRMYVWYGGHWDVRRVGYTYVSTRWVYVGKHWECRDGSWVRVREDGRRHDRADTSSEKAKEAHAVAKPTVVAKPVAKPVTAKVDAKAQPKPTPIAKPVAKPAVKPDPKAIAKPADVPAKPVAKPEPTKAEPKPEAKPATVPIKPAPRATRA